MKNKTLIGLVFLLILSCGFLAIEPIVLHQEKQDLETVKIKSAGEEILADGIVESENQAILRFQMGGKLVYLPFKEGDYITQGQLIAQLDSYDIQKKLEQALNVYQSTRDSFDQYKDNADSGVAQGSQKYSLEVQNKASLGTDEKTNIINDMVKRIADQNQTTLNNAVINVEIAQNAFKLASLYSPISGILTHADTETNLTNISTSTTFIVSDPNKIIFKAQILEQDINFVDVGSSVRIKINNQPKSTLSGNVIKIYPEKIKNNKGESVYEVDIKSDELQKNYKFGQTGNVIISSKYKKNTTVIPNNLILDNQYVWIKREEKIILQKVTLGNTYNNKTIILDGLKTTDQIITDPKYLIKKFYQYI